MKRMAASASLTGLGLMTGVAFVLCRSSTLELETKVLLFLFGIALFVLGGSGYAAGAHERAGRVRRAHSADARSASVRKRAAG